MLSSAPTEFETRTASQHDQEGIFQHMSNFFFKDEPMCMCFGHEPDDIFYEDLNNFVAELLQEPDNCLILLHKGALVGVALNTLQERDQPVQFTENTIKSRKFQHISNILEHVEKESKLFEKYPNCNKILTITMLSVDTSYRGQGLAKLLVDKTR